MILIKKKLLHFYYLFINKKRPKSIRYLLIAINYNLFHFYYYSNSRVNDRVTLALR